MTKRLVRAGRHGEPRTTFQVGGGASVSLLEDLHGVVPSRPAATLWPRCVRSHGVSRSPLVLLGVLFLYGCAAQAPVTQTDRSKTPANENEPARGTPSGEPAALPVAPPAPKPTPTPEEVRPPAESVQPAPKPAPAAQPAPKPVARAPARAPTTSASAPAAVSTPAPPSAKPPEPGKEPLETVPVIELEKLPLAVNPNWTLDSGRDPVSKRNRCFLRSTTQRIEDGQGGSNISLIVTGETLRIATRSNIDLSYKDTGLQVDSKAAFPLQRLFGETDALFDKRVSEIKQQMLGGSSVTVTLGFWPTWPVTQAYSAHFPISGYARASAALATCDRLMP